MKRITDLTRAAVRATARLLPTRAVLTLTCAAVLATGLASCTADDLASGTADALNPDATPLTVASLPGFADTATPGTRADFDPSAPIGTTDPGKTDWAKGDTLAMQVLFFADTEPATQPFGTTYAYAIYNGSAWVLGNGLTTVNHPGYENLPLAVAGGKVAWPARAKAMLVYAVYAPGQTFAANGYLCTTRPEDAGQREWWQAFTDRLTTPGDAIVLNNWQALCARIRVAAAPGDVVKFAAPHFCPMGGLAYSPLSAPAGTDSKRPGEPVDFLTATADSLGNAYFYGRSGEKTPVTVSLTRSTLYAETETPVFQGEKLFLAPATAKSYAINALAESAMDGSYNWGDTYVGTAAGVDKTKSKWVITDEAPEYTVLKSALNEIANADATRRVSIELLRAKSVGEMAFVGCTALESVNLPVATNIGKNAFDGCKKLATLALPEATEIGESAFNDCAALQSATLPKAVSIGASAFHICAKLTTITLPVATEIGRNAFHSCTALQSVTLTKATEIGQYAFFGCTSLATVELPAATTFGAGVFDGCTALATVKLGAATNIGTLFKNSKSLKTLYAPAVTSIESQAFAFCTSLESITLTKATEIGQQAFFGCTALATVKLPVATSIGAIAFNGCANLTTIALPAAVNIGEQAFNACAALQSAMLPKAVSIGARAFYACANLTTIALPAATEIGQNAFDGCTALESITLTKATEIGQQAFFGCTSLQSVTLPAATEIGHLVFTGCTALTTLTFGTPITKWGVSVLLNGANPANITLTLAAGQKAMEWNGTVGVFNATAAGFDFTDTNKTFCGGDNNTPYTFAAIRPAPAAR